MHVGKYVLMRGEIENEKRTYLFGSKENTYRIREKKTFHLNYSAFQNWLDKRLSQEVGQNVVTNY
jgi:hypothetical protein